MRSIFTDEKGNLSCARVALGVVLLTTLGLVVLDSIGMAKVSAGTNALLTTVLMSLIGWAAGPRIAQYLLPQLGAAVQAVSKAATRPYGPSTKAFDDGK